MTSLSTSSSSLSTFEDSHKIKKNNDDSKRRSSHSGSTSSSTDPIIVQRRSGRHLPVTMPKLPFLHGRRSRGQPPKEHLPPLRPPMRWNHARGKESPRGATTTRETTPLLASSPEEHQLDDPLVVDAGEWDVEQLLPNHPPGHGQDMHPNNRDPWKILKERINHGDLLLSGISQERLEDRISSQRQMAKQEQKIQMAINEIRKGMEFNLSHCLLAIFLYLAISVICFNTILEPEWSVLDSCYFAMVTVTTVGYGDEVPTSAASIVFTCIYSCLGVAILGIALGILGTKLVDAQDAMASKAEDLLKYQVLSVFDSTSDLQKRARKVMVENDEDLDCHTLQHEEEMVEKDSLRKPSFFRSLALCLKGFLPLACLMLGMAYWIGHRAGWTFLEVIYFMIVTATTVGYGDFTPKTDQEKLIALLFIPMAVGATGVWLGGVAHVIVESYSAKYRHDLCMKELTQYDLDVMDSNNDGKVSRAEFLEFMLVAMRKIDQGLVEELRAYFDRLDVDGTGELTRDDLIEAARKKLKSPTHKLQLAMYKKHLLEKCADTTHAATRRASAVRLFGTEWGSRVGNS